MYGKANVSGPFIHVQAHPWKGSQNKKTPKQSLFSLFRAQEILCKMFQREKRKQRPGESTGLNQKQHLFSSLRAQPYSSTTRSLFRLILPTISFSTVPGVNWVQAQVLQRVSHRQLPCLRRHLFHGDRQPRAAAGDPEVSGDVKVKVVKKASTVLSK